MSYQKLPFLLVFSLVLKLAFCSQVFAQAISIGTPYQTVARPYYKVQRYNAGGPNHTDFYGRVWKADSQLTITGAHSTFTTSNAISGTIEDPLYQSERYGVLAPFGYSIPVRNGTYHVVFHFAELYWTTSGQRVFDVTLEGQNLITSLDIYAQVGQFASLTKTVVVPVTDGTLDIQFAASVNNPKVSAFEIYRRYVPVHSTPTPTPTATPSPTPTVTPTATPTPTPTPGTTTIFLNSGGPSYVDSNRDTWEPDTTVNITGTSSTFSTSSSISGTTDQALYQSERYGVLAPFGYSIPVPNGAYELDFHFAELYWSQPGQRVFDVSVEGQVLIDDLDIFDEVGQFAALTKTVVATVTDGVLDIDLVASVNNPKLSALKIHTHEGHPYLHVVMDLPEYAVDYDSNGSEVVMLDGTGSHTHQPGMNIISYDWRVDGNTVGTTAIVPATIPNGQHTLFLEIGDDNQPQETLSDSTEFEVYPINAVGGLLSSYYKMPSGSSLSTFIDSLPVSADFIETAPDFFLTPEGINIGESPFSSDTVVVYEGEVFIPATGSYDFNVVGANVWRLFINGQAVTTPLNLSAGYYPIELRYGVSSVVSLPADLFVSVNGSAQIAVPGSILRHSEVGALPFINSMPTTGSSFGGEQIEITGFGFFTENSVSLDWGGALYSGSALTVSPKKIVFTTPPGNGQINVSVITPQGTSNVKTFQYDNSTVPVNFHPPVTIDNVVSGAPFAGPTQAEWGPDGRLYVGSTDGELVIYTFDDNYSVVNKQVVPALSTASNPTILGLAFNPHDSAGPPKLYVAHSKLFHTGSCPIPSAFPYFGQISELVGPSFTTVNPVVTGLPVSNHDHGVNGLEFDDRGDLLIAIGGNTNAGVIDCGIGGLPESPFSAGILKARLSDPNFSGIINYMESQSGSPNNDARFGDIVDPVPGSGVSVFVPGLRNPYDLVYTTQARVYATDNGPNTGFGAASTGPNTQAPDPEFDDEIVHVVEGNYYGHPNRNRGRYTYRENIYLDPLQAPILGGYTPPLEVVIPSTNGIDEYRATTFNSAMRGDLLAKEFVFSGGGHVYRSTPSADGRTFDDHSILMSGEDGLDLVSGPGGALVLTDYAANKLHVFLPDDISLGGMQAFDIFPWRAAVAGGMPFVIGGHSFGSLANTSVTIGGQQATLTSVSPTRIHGTIPAALNPTSELLDVVVTSNSSSSTIEKGFRYVLGTSEGKGEWSVDTPMTHSIGEAASGIIDGVIYVVGNTSNTTQAFNISDGTWTDTLAQRPFPGDHHASEVIGSKWYLIGGLGASSENKLQIYDTETDSWSLGMNLPNTSGSGNTAVINGLIYLAGGISGNHTTTFTSVYDPATNTWNSLAPMPVGRNHAAAGTDGEKLYVFGGRDGTNVVGIGFDDVMIYDPATDTWDASFFTGSTIPSLPQMRGGMGKAAYYQNEFYVMGGETTSAGTGQVSGNVYDRVDVYNPVTQTWRVDTTIPTPRHGFFPIAYDGRIWAIGGGPSAGGSHSTTVEYFRR